ncbi:hypothetical protein ACJX0J_038557, partial [Zea mays]
FAFFNLGFTAMLCVWLTAATAYMLHQNPRERKLLISLDFDFQCITPILNYMHLNLNFDLYAAVLFYMLDATNITENGKGYLFRPF